MRQWSIRRGRLSHDLVSNQLIQHLAALDRVAGGFVTSLDDMAPSLRELWGLILKEAVELHATLLVEMSPGVLFEEPPLCYCSAETKSWLKPFIHERWLGTTSAAARLAQLAAAAGDADIAINQLLERMRGATRCSEFADCVAEARAAAENLSEALAAMPNSSLP